MSVGSQPRAAAISRLTSNRLLVRMPQPRLPLELLQAIVQLGVQDLVEQERDDPTFTALAPCNAHLAATRRVPSFRPEDLLRTLASHLRACSCPRLPALSLRFCFRASASTVVL